jgi:uncharacterized repeat protein (TIGR01451 family)
MQRIIGNISRAAALATVAFLCATGAGAAQSAADLEVYLQKIPVTEVEATDFSITYRIDVSNAGSGDAENVVVKDVLPAEVVFESTPTAGCSFDEPTRTFTCHLGLLPAETDATVELVVRTPSVPATIVNTASVSSSTPDPDPADNTVTLSLDVVQAG